LHTLNTKKHVKFYLPLPISVNASMFTVSAFIFLTLTPNISILLPAIPQISLVPSIALDIQHFSKPSTVTSGEICYHADMIHDVKFSPRIVFRILNTCDLVFVVLCLCSGQSSCFFLRFLISGLTWVLFLSLVVHSNF